MNTAYFQSTITELNKAATYINKYTAYVNKQITAGVKISQFYRNYRFIIYHCIKYLSNAHRNLSCNKILSTSWPFMIKQPPLDSIKTI